MGFLKALDFSLAFADGIDTVEALQNLTASFSHERDILLHFGERRLSHVVYAIDFGIFQVPGLGEMEGRVHYLIFEKAECDVRIQIDTNKAFDFVWAMQVARDATVGLWQIHRELIAHQDLKPSNVLIYNGKNSRIADFGRASQRGRPALHDEHAIPGDHTYAAPELMYGFKAEDFNVRRFGSDLYMLGNLIAFLFSGANLTTSLMQRLAPEHVPDNWQGSYREILPFLEHAFAQTVTDITAEIHQAVRAEVVQLIWELCHPDLQRRGIPKRIGKSDQYSLERYVSRLERLAKEAEVRRRIARSAA